jgi:hypothetical protein
MKLLAIWLMATAQAAVTGGAEMRSLVEALSGAARLGVGGLPTTISQRFSDSAEIQTSALFLQHKYRETGIEAEIANYDPMEAFPYYRQNTDETYRSYFRHLTPRLQTEFDGFCSGTLSPEKREEVEKRLKRVNLERGILCGARSQERVEVYIQATVEHTTEITRAMLSHRALAVWPNVLAYVSGGKSLEGEAGPRPICVIGAHMDSVAREGGGRGPIVSPGTLAPGADDNASGTAAVLTLARVARDWLITGDRRLPCDLVFAHFSGEEEGLLGSLAFTRLQNKRPVLWMVNFDMIAYHTAGAAEPLMNVGYDAKFGDALARSFAGASTEAPRTLVVERNVFIYSSDQIAFWTLGIPALSVSEEACSEAKECKDPYKNFNPKLHTPDDVVQSLDFDYAAAIVDKSFEGLKALLTAYRSR